METLEPFNIIYQTAEDGLGDTVKPRLMEADADLERVLVIDDRDTPLTLADERIARAIRENNARLVMQYKGDERWKLIQLNANNAANISNTVLIVLIVVLPLLIDSQTTFTLQRVVTFVLIYIGIRNLIELVATIYFDKRL